MAVFPAIRSSPHLDLAAWTSLEFPARNHPLYLRLESFDPDVRGIDLPFSARLARENGWTQDYARRVIEDYKRFLFLVSVSDQMLTPSEAVDEAWHLHLIYSKSYWDELCGKVLERPLHHEPTVGGETQSAMFRECYERTIAAYQHWFDQPPAEDIWPTADSRFAAAGEGRRVNTAEVWIVRKELVEQVCYGVAAISFGVAMVFPEYFALAGLLIAVFAVAAGLIIGNARRILPSRWRRGGGECGAASCGGGCGGCGG